jgi:hypothetical protein
VAPQLTVQQRGLARRLPAEGQVAGKANRHLITTPANLNFHAGPRLVENDTWQRCSTSYSPKTSSLLQRRAVLATELDSRAARASEIEQPATNSPATRMAASVRRLTGARTPCLPKNRAFPSERATSPRNPTSTSQLRWPVTPRRRPGRAQGPTWSGRLAKRQAGDERPSEIQGTQREGQTLRV